MNQKLIPKHKFITKANSGVKMQKPHFTEEERQELIKSGIPSYELWEKSLEDKDLENKLLETFYYMPKYSDYEGPVDTLLIARDLVDGEAPINFFRYHGDRTDNPIELPDAIVTPSELQLEFFRVNPNIYKNNPKFFNAAYSLSLFRDEYTSEDNDEMYDFLNWYVPENYDYEKIITSLDNPEVIDRFYKLWELSGKPKIENHLPSYYFDRAYMNSLTRNIYLSNSDNMDTAIAELAHIAENNYEPGQRHNIIDGLLNLEEFGNMDWNYTRYDVPGTQEFKTHNEVEPMLNAWVFMGYPTKFLPKKPITTYDNISNNILNMFGGTPLKSIMKFGTYFRNKFFKSKNE